MAQPSYASTPQAFLGCLEVLSNYESHNRGNCVFCGFYCYKRYVQNKHRMLLCLGKLVIGNEEL